MKIKPNSIQLIYSSHLLEHLYRAEAEALLRNLFEGLQDEGIIRIALPDYDQFILKFLNTFKDNPVQANLEFERALLSHPEQKPTKLSTLWNSFTGNLHIHRWHPNFAVMQEMMQKIGFQDITRREFRDSALQGIRNLENRNEFTFYIEAIKRK